MSTAFHYRNHSDQVYLSLVMTEIMVTSMPSLFPVRPMSESLSPKPCIRSLRPKICILPELTESKIPVQSPLYQKLTAEEEARACALVSSLRDIDCLLGCQLEDINLRDDKKRLKPISLGDPSNSPCMMRRMKSGFSAAATLALQETKSV